MEPFEVLIKTQRDGIRFDLYCRPVQIDNIRLEAPDFEEFMRRLHATPQGVVIDYAGYLEPDLNNLPTANENLSISCRDLQETPHGMQFDLVVGEEKLKGLLVEKGLLEPVLLALQAKK